MTQKRKNPAVQGGVQCALGKTHTDNTILRLIIQILSHPGWLCERRTITAATEAIFRELMARLGDRGGRCPGVISGGEHRLLYLVHWWQLLPYGLWIERDGAYALFDRNYCPIVRIRRYGRLEIVPPYERIDKIATRWFYEDATAPYLDPQTAPTIVLLAADCGLEREIEYRWSLTDRGRAPYKALAKRWKPR